MEEARKKEPYGCGGEAGKGFQDGGARVKMELAVMHASFYYLV